ncbi:cytosolic carboxypeptidase-like protein 5 isoform X2 [Microplitis mediator]|uniref:cytosolic carboxypeptidase-like protein 5 isoform X2 n=1 Tax=Microplitis mediator TaxID=375433 RepID=UPI002554BA7D|nr:cytosolic carboxypeptidase-like protein 5 isoform X2 [Microplitis mediator]
MATTEQDITVADFIFYNNFDSANLAKVEQVNTQNAIDQGASETVVNKSCKISDDQQPEYEFNVWTKHDCHGTEFQNNNRTWFYFGIKSPVQNISVKLNVVNLNRQSKMFSQGMCPVFKVIPGHPHWERIRDKPTYTMDQKGSEFTLSFIIRTPENLKAIIYVAFTYPFTYSDLQHYLNRIDARISKQNLSNPDAIYYHRECAIKSLEGRRLEVLTVSSYHNIWGERENNLKGLYPEPDEQRSFKFRGKRTVFVSARVHPDDPIAIILRRIYVFKLIPMLNPDGVARGHYRMDTRGVNLNRVYLNPSYKNHPTIFAARSLIRYYHNFYEEIIEPNTFEETSLELDKEGMEIVNAMTLDKDKCLEQLATDCESPNKEIGLIKSDKQASSESQNNIPTTERTESANSKNSSTASNPPRSSEHSGLFLYVDLHGHASKKGIFMYGNYFDDPDDTIMCMLLPKLMSINNSNFHFTSCNFTEKNMYLIDKRDGMSREGSGRVAVYKMTGLVRSYTLECNYNSGRLVNTIPARIRDLAFKPPGHMFVPPKYTPTVFEEVGAALGPSILDLTNSNPNSRLSNSQYRSLRGVKSYLKLTYVNNLTTTINKPRSKHQSIHDNVGLLKDTTCLEDIITTMGSLPSEEASNNTQKNETSSPAKSRIVHRTSSLYSTVKRIKNGKRSARQLATTNRKSLKNQRRIMNNVENGQMISKIRSSRLGVKATMLKSSAGRRHLPDKSHLQKIINKHPSGKTTIEIITEQTTSVIKTGTKRLKVLQNFLKTRPEIGESSKSMASPTASSSSSSSSSPPSSTGGVGTKRMCSSVDYGNTCNFDLAQPGDTLAYRTCVYTCSTDGCNPATMNLPNIITIAALTLGIIYLFRR